MNRPVVWIAVSTQILLIVLWGTFGGINDSSAEVGVSAFVVQDNSPLMGADVFFICGEAGERATSRYGRSNIAGEYRMLNGVKPGVYRVVIKKIIGPETAGSGPMGRCPWLGRRVA